MHINPSNQTDIVDRLRYENKKLRNDNQQQLAEQRSTQEAEYDMLNQKHSKMMDRHRRDIESMRSEDERRRKEHHK